MGGCATKPRELKEEDLAPRPIEEEKAEVPPVQEIKAVAATETEPANDVVVVDDSQRKSLGHFFKESEESKVEAPETEEVRVKEAIVEPAVEAKEEEQPKTQEPTADEKFITPRVPEETPAPSEEATATDQEKHVDSSSDVIEEVQTPKVEAVVAESPKVEQKEAVAATEEGNAELQVTTSSTKKVVVEELPTAA